MLHAQHLFFSRRDGSALFSDLSLHLPRERHGLIGVNGIGKSVLGRLLAGELRPDGGQILRPARVGLFRQMASQVGSVATVLGLADKLAALQAIERGDAEPRLFDILEDDWQLVERATAWLAESGLKAALTQPFASLSGGEQARLRLLALFKGQFDYLILDEPGNHLDRQGRTWLRQQLDEFDGGLLLISHDRRLLADVAMIHELSSLGLHSHGGNYQVYQEQKSLEQAAAAQALESAQKALRQAGRQQQLAHERAQQRAKQGRRLRDSGSQSKLLLDMRKQGAGDHLGRLGRVQQRQSQQLGEELHQARLKLEQLSPQQLTLEAEALRARTVLRVVGLHLPHGIDRPIDWVIKQGEKWHLAGANGSGKSTLLRVLHGAAPSTAPIERHGRIAYLDQHLRLGDDEDSALAILQAHQPGVPGQTLRGHLAHIGLRAGAGERPFGLLSGGERLKLALQCCQGAALLLLDEPDNHLDLPSRELLQRALREFTGAVLLVSHDDEFVADCGVNMRYILTSSDSG